MEEWIPILLRIPRRAPRRRVDLIKNDLVAVNRNKNSRSKIMKNKISRFPALSLAVVAMLAFLNAQSTDPANAGMRRKFDLPLDRPVNP